MKFNLFKYMSVVLLTTSIISCEDFLDKEPPSYAVPEDYYQSEDQLQAAANGLYTAILPTYTQWSYGPYGVDVDTDNQADFSPAAKYATGQWKTSMTNGNWAWGNIRNVNYTLSAMLENYKNNKISGLDANIRHYIGEIYFLRAYSYFDMLQKWGDLPILEEALTDDEAVLVAASIRRPRNEVARFIIQDLDNAIQYMVPNFDSRRNRISPDVARLMKSRVALFEGSWLTYFKGTAFVPNGNGWPGKAKDYNADYEYPSGNIDNEIAYFLNEAVESAEEVASKYVGNLVTNTGIVPQSTLDVNPYFYMFGNTDMSSYPEVLLWRQYDEGLGLTNNIECYTNASNYGAGLTRSMVEGFVMKDGKPIYAAHNGFTYNDETLSSVREHADPRLNIFLKENGQTNLFKNMESPKNNGVVIEPVPSILIANAEWGYSTGYTMRKGGTFDKALTGNGQGYTGTIIFRATEALLNYMEAQYMLTGNLASGKILTYWRAIRSAAGFIGDAVEPQVTIDATVMENEKLDWGSYSAGNQLTDATLYNIRRERRCELMGEALRWMDLIRWRALDQMKTQNYHIEGFRLWGTPMESWYDAGALVSDGSSSATVSSFSLSEYLRPYEKNMSASNLYKDGYSWSMAHYLEPLPIKEMQLTATDYVTPELSSLYQNPYWPTTANLPAKE